MDFLIPIFNTLVLAVATILLIVGLMSAPWQLLLLILVAGILASKWLIRQSQLQDVLEDIEGLESSQPIADIEAPAASPMEQPSPPPQCSDANTLSYRGANYASGSPTAPSANQSKSVLSGKYRGGHWGG
jgi:hypothetical protein